jgi:hypothetical protein
MLMGGCAARDEQPICQTYTHPHISKELMLKWLNLDKKLSQQYAQKKCFVLDFDPKL